MLNRFINRETALYLLFGVMTTIVSFGSFLIFDRLLGQDCYLISNVISFVFATSFAFITNKVYVFQSKTWKCKIVIKEAFSFFSARIGTFMIVEEMGLWILVQFFQINRMNFFLVDGVLFAKISLSFLAVLLNYILSKFLIFRKE